MLLSDISIKRPVFATVLSILLLVFGLVSFLNLPLREYPNIDPPVVSVDVNYPGAPANIVETRITQLIEERISGIEGIETIESVSRDGRSVVNIEFSVNRDIDAAANDVRDRVSGVQDNLPQEAEPPEIQKADSNDSVIIWQNLASARMSVPELTDFARRYLVDQYSSLDGVARVRVGGGLNYAVRIWLERGQLAARGLTVSDVEAALRRENLELPAGSFESDQMLFKGRVNRIFDSPEAFKNLVIARQPDGQRVRLADVARVSKDVVEDRTFFRGNGIPMVGIGIVKQSTANTINVASRVKELTARINPGLPDGTSIEQSYDASVFIKAAISEVYSSLAIAILCVITVIYLFLGSARATIIPAITVPVSLVGTAIFVYWLGFSINLLTLLALVLAIGLIVDDAIVVLENINRRMRNFGEPALLAAYQGTREVSFAVVATTLVLISVFIPITFLEGDLGRLFTEFALTIAASVGISSFVALSLSAMLASKFLDTKQQPKKMVQVKKPNQAKTTWLDKLGKRISAPKLKAAASTKSAGASASNAALHVDSALGKVRSRYLKALNTCIRRPILVGLAYSILLGLSIFLYSQLPEELTPKEDRGAFFIFVNGPEGASYNFIRDYMNEIENDLMPYVESGEVKRLLVRAPRAFGNIENFNSGFVIVLLNEWQKRRPVQVIMGEIRRILGKFEGIRAFPVMRQGIGGRTQKPVQLVLGGPSYSELAKWRDIMIGEAQAQKIGLLGLDSDYKETRPQIDFQLDYARASSLGVSAQNIGRTLETLMGGRRVTSYLEGGQEYDVIIEGVRDQQRSFADLESIHVRSETSGQLIPLSNLVQIKEYGAAQTLSRFNRTRAITLSANLDPNQSLGGALNKLSNIAKELLPDYARIDHKGQSRDFVGSGRSILFVFLLGTLIVFLVLAAQFESFIHPLIIILTVPLASGGGLLGLYLGGMSLNIYSQIGIIILIGLAAKNGILIVEFANQLRDKGLDFDAALAEAADVRFRPIVMTGLTTIAGALPLVLASGAGSETRAVIGVVILAGVIAATLFTLFLVPTAYSVFARRTGSPKSREQMLSKQIEEREDSNLAYDAGA